MAIDSGYWGNGAALDSGYWESGEDTNVLTNADHIRSMTDEELSVLLAKPWCENHRSKEECLRFDTDCQACVADWLRQPYEEDT